MRRRHFLLAPVFLAAAADKAAWRKASVLHAEYKPDNAFTGMAQAGGPTAQVFRGEFDFDAGDTIYTARESVAGQARLPLAEGDEVLLLIDKSTLRLKLPNGKERRLKLAATQPKTKR
jgi:hypothetical protein